jgi:hypothetical protein
MAIHGKTGVNKTRIRLLMGLRFLEIVALLNGFSLLEDKNGLLVLARFGVYSGRKFIFKAQGSSR